MRTLSYWLTGIILLTIIAFLAVFKPITLTARKDPSDPEQYIKPAFADAKFSSSVEPKAFTQLPGGKNLYLYVPQHDLRLGLDLRGGLRVVMEASNRAEFNYKLTKVIETSGEASDKQGELADIFRKRLGDEAKGSEVFVDTKNVQVITLAQDPGMAKAQLKKLDEAMTEVFGAGNYEWADKDKEPFKKVSAEELSSIRDILETRLNQSGTMEVAATTKGDNQVVVEIPGVKDPERVYEIIGKTASLKFMILPTNISVTDNDNGGVTLTRGSEEISDEEALKAATLILRGNELKPNTTVVPDRQRPGAYAVEFNIRANKEKYFGAMTGAYIKRQMAIVLDDKIMSAPVIQDAITGGRGIISGNFSSDEAQKIKVWLNGGAMPVPVKIMETRTVSATLGQDSVAMSMFAGIIGLLAVLIFMGIYYRLPGLMANLALIIYVFLSLAVLKLFDATLTLPGIAGIIISIGMAVDANVIIFERLKEELRTQKPLDTAIDVAFSRAFTAILDSNVASMITGVVLLMLGTGAVKGFAVTLLIGVGVSLFTAITVTRLFMKLMIRTKAGHKLSWYGV